MRKITWKAKGKYDCYVLVDDEKKLILKISCQCPSFLGIVKDKEGKSKLIKSKIKSFGINSYEKHYAYSCKHLKKATDPLEKIGYKFKIPTMEGTDKCTPELRKFIMERSEGICERFVCKEDGEEIHRRTPGHAGGKYNKENCVILCKGCHKFANAKECPHISG